MSVYVLKLLEVAAIVGRQSHSSFDREFLHKVYGGGWGKKGLRGWSGRRGRGPLESAGGRRGNEEELWQERGSRSMKVGGGEKEVEQG